MTKKRKCPCGSGKPYKSCCGENPVIYTTRTLEGNRQRKIEKIRRTYTKELDQLRYCSWPGCTETKDIINAHSISEKYILPITDESNHVLNFRSTIDDMRLQLKGKIKPTRIGIQEATTFKGFCGEHDKFFNPIDNCWKQDPTFYFMHTYRTVAYNLYRAKLNFNTQLAMLGEQQLRRTPTPDDIHPELASNMFDYYQFDIHANELAKAKWDEMLGKNNFSDLESFIQYFEISPRMAIAMTFPSFHYFDGTKAHVNIYHTPETPQVQCFLLPFDKTGGVLLVTWHKDIRAYARPQWESFNNCSEKNKSNLLIKLFFHLHGGTLLEQFWWNSIGISKQNFLIRIANMRRTGAAGLSDVINESGRYTTSIADWKPTNSAFNPSEIS